MNRLLILSILLPAFLFPFQSALSAEGKKPVVLAVSEITRIGMRERVISDLLEKYDCCVLSRSRGYNLAVEKSLATLDALCAAETIPAADFAVVVEIISTSDPEIYDGMVKILNIGSSETNTEAVKFFGQPLPASRTNVVEAIASVLDLEPKTTSSSSFAEPDSNLTWMVMPFLRFDNPRGGGGGIADPDLFAHCIEFALQESPSVGRLVAHNNIAAILEEHHLNALQASGQSAVSALARIVGADRIVMASVSSKENNARRIDIHLLDARTAAIMDARSVECNAFDQIGDRAAQAVAEMAAAATPAPSIPASTEVARIREAEFYLEKPARFGAYDGFLLQRLNNAEAAYLLGKQEGTVLSKVIRELYVIVHGATGYNSGYAQASAERACRLLEFFLQSVRNNLPPETPHPSLIMADVYNEMDQFEKAKSMAEKYLNTAAPSKRNVALFFLANANMELGDLDAASRFFNLFLKENGGLDAVGVYYDVYRPTFLHTKLEQLKEKHLSNKEKFYITRQRMRADGYRMRLDEWDVYIDLLKEFHGLEKAVDELDFWIKWDRRERAKYAPHLGTDMHWANPHSFALKKQADFYLELDKKKEAAQNIKAVWEISSREPACYKKRNAEAFRMIQDIEREIGHVPEKWKSAGQFRPIPAEFSICIVPVGRVFTDGIEASARLLGRYFGARVRILDAVPEPQSAFPDDSMFGKKELFWNGVLESASIPNDTLFVALVTERTLKGEYDHGSFANDTRLACSFNLGNPVLIEVNMKSSQDTYADYLKKYYAYNLAHHAALSFHYLHREKTDDFRSPSSKINLYGTKQCGFPCLFYESVNFLGNRVDTVFGLCPQCQEEYKRVDFEKTHRDLMNYLHELGASLVSPNQVSHTKIDPEDGGEWYMLPLVGASLAEADLRTPSGKPGLRGDYFNGTNLESNVFSRVDSDINFRWDDGESPDAAIGDDNFSVRWTGTFTPRKSGTYRFQTFSDDGVRLWIDGEKVIDNWTDHAITFDISPCLEFESDTAREIRLEYYESRAAGIIRLFWRRALTNNSETSGGSIEKGNTLR